MLNFIKSKKGQSEIMGMVVVVLLIAIGILIAIVIFSKPTGKDLKYEQESLFAANFLNTLVKSDGFCRGRSIGELIQNCAESSGTGAVACDNGLDACSQAKSLINDIFDEVFTKRGLSFYFNIKDSEDNFVDGLDDFIFGSECKGEYESKTRPLVFLGGELYIKLDIC